MGEDLIQRVSNYTYLGVTLDEQLSFDAHAKTTIKRVSNKVMQLKRMRCFLNRKAATLIYKNMILPIMEYENIFLSSATKANKKKLQILQNKALRSMLQTNQRVASLPMSSIPKLIFKSSK